MVGGGFGPNILSLLVLIEIRIRLKLGCDNKNERSWSTPDLQLSIDVFGWGQGCSHPPPGVLYGHLLGQNKGLLLQKKEFYDNH